MLGQHLQYGFTVLHSSSGRNAPAEHRLLAVIVQELNKLKAASLPWVLQRPARKAPRHFSDIVLGISSVHPQGMQFHEFARVVLVEAARPSCLGRELRRSIAILSPTKRARAPSFREPGLGIGSQPH